MNDQVEKQIQLIKLKRIQELNSRLKETLKRERIPASRACELIINYVEETPDYLIPYNWKLPTDQNKFASFNSFRHTRQAQQQSLGCCIIM